MVGLVDDDERVRRGVDTRLAKHEPPSACPFDAHRPRPALKWRHQHVHALHNMLGRLARRDDEPLADKERQRFVSRHEKDHRSGSSFSTCTTRWTATKVFSTARRCEQHRNRRARTSVELLALVHRQLREPHHDSRVTLHERAAINVNIDAGAVDAELSEKRRLRGRRAQRTVISPRNGSLVLSRHRRSGSRKHKAQFLHLVARRASPRAARRRAAGASLIAVSNEPSKSTHVAQPGEGRDVGDA